jgi:hypothetical protein
MAQTMNLERYAYGVDYTVQKVDTRKVSTNGWVGEMHPGKLTLQILRRHPFGALIVSMQGNQIN